MQRLYRTTSPSRLRLATSPKFSEINPYGFVKLPPAVKCLRTREDLFFYISLLITHYSLSLRDIIPHS